VIDLRTLMPYDKAAIFRSLDKTSRVLVVHEDVKTLGLGAELSAVIMEEKFDALDAPVLRVTYPDTHPPFSHILEGRTCRTPTRSPTRCARSSPTDRAETTRTRNHEASTKKIRSSSCLSSSLRVFVVAFVLGRYPNSAPRAWSTIG
jgi:hypothetical protein